jgi:hypothetical protein
MTYIVVDSGSCCTITQSLYILSNAQLRVLQFCVKERDDRKEVAGRGKRQTTLPTCFSLPTMGNLHNSQNMYSYIELNVIVLISFLFLHLLITFAGADKNVRQAESGPRAVVWRSLLHFIIVRTVLLIWVRKK